MIFGAFRQEFPASLSCDVAVIGSGAGGSSVASALTAAGLDVVLIEEGPFVNAERVPETVPRAMLHTWRGGGLTLGLGKPTISYAEGRCVGGGTEINSAIMQRVHSELLDEWGERYRIAEFGGAALRPFYDRAAKIVNAAPPAEPPGPASDVLLRAGIALGWKTTLLERAQRHCVGSNFCPAGCGTGARQSMTATLIPEALGRGMRLLAETRVERLVIKGGRVAEIRADATDHCGRVSRVRVRPAAVFVCAGAVHTPALLRRSGITRNVGDRLRMHPTIKAVCRFAEPLDAHASVLPVYAITEFMPDLRIGGSVFQPGLFGMALAEDWDKRGWMMREWRNGGLYYAMVRAAGVGRVRTLPGVREPIVIYAMTPGDVATLSVGMARLGEAMFAAGATHVFPSITGHGGWRSPAQCAEFDRVTLPLSAVNLMTIHLFSSCPPGEAPECATDSFGRLRGLENLWVADASQIPEAPGVNPQLTVMALALRSADAYLAHSHSEFARDAMRESLE